MTFTSKKVIPQIKLSTQERTNFDSILIEHLACEELFSGVAVDMGAEEDAPGKGFATVGANMG